MTIAIRKPALGSAATVSRQEASDADRRQMGRRASGETFSVEDPATQEVIAHVPAGDKADIDLAVAGRARGLSRPVRGRASRRPSARGWSGGSATSSNSMPTNSPSSKRSTTASRSPMRAATTCRARSRCSATWPAGRRGSTGETIPVSSPGELARLYAARAGRRRRPDHPVELPADDGGLEARAGARRGLHDRAQAGRADAALGAALRRADPGSRHSRTASSTSSPASARRRARRSPSIPTSTRSPSPARRKSAS